jgi:capsular polysaccharide biosynthesis protein
MYDNYNIPDYGNDIIYSPKAINFVRSSILNWFNVSRREKSKKIYISRNKVSYRNMINSDEIENLLISKGFEIICPERMTFFSQLYLFSQAQIIIGQAGAGMTNLIFAPKDCKVLIITSNIPQINLHCFSSLAHTVGINVEFLIGICKNKSTLAVHSDFYADTKLLLNYLNNVDQLS